MLAMALVGYEIEKKKIDEKIKEIRSQLGGAATVARVGRPSKNAAAAETAAAPKRRKLSAAARKRIAAAQKKRWAEHRKTVAQAAKQPAKTGGS
jgi:hypothetical protein